MDDALEILRDLIDRSPHSLTTASLRAGLGRSTISRWFTRQRTPRAEELDAALRVFGYRLAAVPDTPAEPSSPISF